MRHSSTLNKISTSTLATLMAFSAQSTFAESRPLAADRPDATESPQTVDKGRFQIETTLLGYASDKSHGVRTETFSGLETNIKFGVTDSSDLQFVFTPYVNETVKTSTDSSSNTSHGDMQVRAKFNLWGNDGGNDAFALMPFIKLPSGKFSNDQTEAGLIATYATQLQHYSLGAQLQLDYLHDDENNSMDWAWSHTAVLGYPINNQLGGYLEYIGEYTLENDYLPYASLGFTWQTSQDMQWDIGSKLGLHQKSEDINVFSGFTYRF